MEIGVNTSEGQGVNSAAVSSPQNMLEGDVDDVIQTCSQTEAVQAVTDKRRVQQGTRGWSNYSRVSQIGLQAVTHKQQHVAYPF